MTSNKKNRSDHQNNKNGFSLTEVIIVISILGIIMSVSFATLGKSNERLSLKQAQADILFALEEAQNRAATGFGTKNHGVHIEENKFEIFEGDEYASAGKETNLPPNIFTDKTDTNIIFDRITGSTDGDTIITLTYISGGISGGTKTIKVTQNGKISAQ